MIQRSRRGRVSAVFQSRICKTITIRRLSHHPNVLSCSRGHANYGFLLSLSKMRQLQKTGLTSGMSIDSWLTCHLCGSNQRLPCSHIWLSTWMNTSYTLLSLIYGTFTSQTYSLLNSGIISSLKTGNLTRLFIILRLCKIFPSMTAQIYSKPYAIIL